MVQEGKTVILSSYCCFKFHSRNILSLHFQNNMFLVILGEFPYQKID